MDLEKEVGLPLLRRSTRQVELTEAGKALQKGAKELISRWEKMLPEVRNQVAEEAQTLSLTIGVDARALANPVRRHRFLGTIYEMRRSYPGLRVLLRNRDYQELMKGLSDGTLDCALVLDRELEQKSDFQQEAYGQEEMVLVFRSENAHHAGDHAHVIMNRGLILVDKEPQGLYHIIHMLSDLRLEPQIRFCKSLEDMTMTVETGESAAILPESVVAKLHNPALQTLHLPSDHAKLTLSMIWSKNQTNPLLPELRERLRQMNEIT